MIQEVVAHRDDALGGGRFEEPRRNLVDWIGDDSMMRGSSTDRTDRSDRRDSPKDTHACVGESRHGPAATLHALAAGVALETFRAANQSIGKKMGGRDGTRAKDVGTRVRRLRTSMAPMTERSEGTGGSDGTRTRGLRRDRPAF